MIEPPPVSSGGGLRMILCAYSYIVLQSINA